MTNSRVSGGLSGRKSFGPLRIFDDLPYCVYTRLLIKLRTPIIFRPENFVSQDAVRRIGSVRAEVFAKTALIWNFSKNIFKRTLIQRSWGFQKSLIVFEVKPPFSREALFKKKLAQNCEVLSDIFFAMTSGIPASVQILSKVFFIKI